MDQWIIADSGGTKTDWCRVNSTGIVERMQTDSYHPVYFTEALREEMKLFWRAHPDWLELPLYFFGSGCYRHEGQQKAEELLHALGFGQVRVQSDVHAAALATLGNQAGWVAILGTGSVLIEWNGREVVSIHGGKGHQEGDEGSGYYFGHLLMEQYRKHQLDSAAEKLLFDFLRSQTNFPESGQEKAQLASLAKRFGTQSQFIGLHRENIHRFLQNYAQGLPVGTTLHFVGSYAEAQKPQIKELLAEFGLNVGQIIGRPIGQLVEQSVYFVD